MANKAVDNQACQVSIGLPVLLVSFGLLILLAACSAKVETQPKAAATAAHTAIPNAIAEVSSAPDPALSSRETPESAILFDCAAVNQIPAAECKALVALYTSTNGPDWIENEGWLATNRPCSWLGITCKGEYITHISLSYNQLSGPLPTALGDLSHLQTIEMGSNWLSGSIPAELGNLSELVALYLWGNRLIGPIPTELGNLEKLRTLSLARNQFSGSIPATLGNALSLESLDLSNNQLSGDIPPELGDLDNLYALYLSYNQLSGAIPAEFGSLRKLAELDLSYNQLRGSVPEYVSHIDQLMLWGNQLAGTVNNDGQAPFVVDFMGVQFMADPSLATSIWPEEKSASPLPDDLEGPAYWLAMPEHLRFTFTDPYLPAARRPMGFHLAAEGQILVIPLAELAAMNPMVQAQIEKLQNLLAERAAVPAGDLPLLPLTNSAQVFHAQTQYLDSGNIQGLRYISQHSQDPHPIMLSQELFYTFQGFTDDGAHYVAAFFPLTTAALPETIEIEDWEAFHANYEAYLAETTALLDQFRPDGYTPELTLLDAVVTSLRIETDDTASGIQTPSEQIVVEEIPSEKSLDHNYDPMLGFIAYQQNGKLWLNEADLSGDPVELARCTEPDKVICDLPKVHISPNGSHFFFETTAAGDYQLLISDLEVLQQGYRFSQPPSRDPVWSPDGNRIIVFMVDTGRPWGNHGDPELPVFEYGFTEEVWQLEMDALGEWLPPQKVTDLETPGIGCGGGGASTSDTLYDIQGGFALGYQAARQMVWTNDGVIIYPLTCDYWQGYGRLNAQTWQPLTPYSDQLRGLTLDPSAGRWYAVTGHNRDDEPANNRLVSGTASTTAYEVIETAVPVEAVFVGPQSGRLYYTSRERLNHKDLSDQIGWNKAVSPYFNFFHTQLWTILPDGSDEKLLWESDDHAYGRVTETAEGELLFVLVENDEELYETIAGGAPEGEWLEHLPHTHIMRLPPGAEEPVIWLEDAHNLTAWRPQS